MAKAKSKYHYELKSPGHWSQSVKGQFDLYAAILDAKNFLIDRSNEKRKDCQNEQNKQKTGVKKTLSNKRNAKNDKTI